MSGTRVGQNEEAQSIRTICWVKTAGRIQREMEGDK